MRNIALRYAKKNALKTEKTFLTTNLTNLESYSSYSLQVGGMSMCKDKK